MPFRDFDELHAVGRLSALSGTPHDLAASGGLTPKRLQEYSVSFCGFDLLYACQRLDGKTLVALQDLADEAGLVEDFMAMKSGAVLNCIEGLASENRQVLHTSCRDVFEEAPRAAEATAKAKAELVKLRRFLEDIDLGRLVNARGEKFTTMVQVGIGGSDLGPRALAMAVSAGRSSTS